MRNGTIVTAQTFAELPNLFPAWRPDRGQTVQQLFEEIEKGIRAGLQPPDGPGSASAIGATYDSATGSPTAIYQGPNSVDAVHRVDTAVSTIVRVTSLPVRPERMNLG